MCKQLGIICWYGAGAVRLQRGAVGPHGHRAHPAHQPGHCQVGTSYRTYQCCGTITIFYGSGSSSGSYLKSSGSGSDF
jgi:hypothetical protein